MSRWITIFATVLSICLAPSAWAGDGTCKIVLRGPAGDHLRVALHVEHGQVTGADVVVSPPLAQTTASDGVLLQLDLHYMRPSESDLGRPAEVALTTFHTNGGDVSDLADARAVLIADDGETWAGRSSHLGSIVRTEFALRIDGGPVVQPELLDKLGQLKNARIEVRAPDGSIIRQASYDLSNQTDRDTLFHAAWTRAEQLATAAAPCR